VRLALFLLILVMGTAVAQDAPKKKSKAAAKKTGQTELKAHQKPTPEQIRKFNELQKKQ
jgi:hypothetical protein